VGAHQQRVAPYYEAIADAIKSVEQGADSNLLLASLDPCSQRGGRAEAAVH
jgi:hypothetical protein